MNITLISVGKIKEKYLVEGIKEYTKRLSAYCKLQYIELKDEKTPDDASEKEMTQIKDAEGLRILSKIKDTQYVITLEINGKMLTSEELAKKMGQLAVTGKSNVVFIIGGSLGLSDAVMKRSNYALSFSKMTFPHQLMKMVLLEQVYRGFRINRGEPYHK